MYIYYQHLRDSNGEVTVTMLKISANGFRWSNYFTKTEKSFFTIVAETLKTEPIASRSYDSKSHTWTFLGSAGPSVIKKLKAIILTTNLIALKEIENFIEIENDQSSFIPRIAKETVEDFFYNAPAALPRESAAEKLQKLLCIDAEALKRTDKQSLRKLYLKTALKLHPDRNNGDGSMMSELNAAWQEFNQ